MDTYDKVKLQQVTPESNKKILNRSGVIITSDYFISDNQGSREIFGNIAAEADRFLDTSMGKRKPYISMTLAGTSNTIALAQLYRKSYNPFTKKEVLVARADFIPLSQNPSTCKYRRFNDLCGLVQEQFLYNHTEKRVNLSQDEISNLFKPLYDAVIQKVLDEE